MLQKTCSRKAEYTLRTTCSMFTCVLAITYSSTLDAHCRLCLSSLLHYEHMHRFSFSHMNVCSSFKRFIWLTALCWYAKYASICVWHLFHWPNIAPPREGAIHDIPNIHTLHYITVHYITLHYITLHYIHYITYIHNITKHNITLHYIQTKHT